MIKNFVNFITKQRKINSFYYHCSDLNTFVTTQVFKWDDKKIMYFAQKLKTLQARNTRFTKTKKCLLNNWTIEVIFSNLQKYNFSLFHLSCVKISCLDFSLYLFAKKDTKVHFTWLLGTKKSNKINEHYTLANHC